MLVRASHSLLCARDRGCSVHPAFPAPSVWGGNFRQTSGASRRENAKMWLDPSPSLRGAQRRSNPLFLRAAKWIASLALAMTEWLFDGMGLLAELWCLKLC